MTLEQLLGFALSRSLFPPTTLRAAIERLGFVQADPIRAPARAQDLMLRQRVRDYRAGDLERHYGKLGIEEDFFVNYGFVPRSVHALMHPRKARTPWSAVTSRRAKALLAFVGKHGEVHPREVDAHFAHGTVTNYWGGSSSATTHLLDAMHYRGLLRVVRRERGVRIYGLRTQSTALSVATQRANLDALIDVIVSTYAPLPARSLNALLARMRYATPQWVGQLKAAIDRAKQRLAHAHLEGVTWYWPADEDPARAPEQNSDESLRLLAPFDPVVWDRRRFEIFWGWDYRFEAYTPVSKRRFGYYALPLLWRTRVIGWGNLVAQGDELDASFGYVRGSAPRDRDFKRELERELERVRGFLTPR
ncbi:MAG: crosslink repair DNA glycosylase YcaQ family protein [Myxococcales bacterium]